MRNALSRSKVLFAGKFFRMDTLFCGSKGKSFTASFIFGMLNKIRSKCTIQFHYVPVAAHHVSSIVSSKIAFSRDDQVYSGFLCLDKFFSRCLLFSNCCFNIFTLLDDQ